MGMWRHDSDMQPWLPLAAHDQIEYSHVEWRRKMMQKLNTMCACHMRAWHDWHLSSECPLVQSLLLGLKPIRRLPILTDISLSFLLSSS